jgi:hypothetical protein
LSSTIDQPFIAEGFTITGPAARAVPAPIPALTVITASATPINPFSLFMMTDPLSSCSS